MSQQQQHPELCPACAELLDALEDMARQWCDSRLVPRDYNGQIAGSIVTDSGAISSNAEILRLLAKHNRFHIVAEHGRMVVGYWPENKPASTP